jgi:hypothetical protein
MNASLAVLAAALALPSAAPAPKPAKSPCRLDPVHVANLQVYGDALGDGRCFVSISPNNAQDLRYRSWGLFEGGPLMVFMSFDDSWGSDSTGAREYYFFPRTARPAADFDAAAPRLVATLPNGDALTFDPAAATAVSLGRGALTVDSRVDRSLRDGTDIPSYDGLLLDLGFAFGHSPASEKKRVVTFRSAQGQLCRVRNEEIFVYSGGDHDFKFDDAALSAWLKSRCPGFAPGF